MTAALTIRSITQKVLLVRGEVPTPIKKVTLTVEYADNSASVVEYGPKTDMSQLSDYATALVQGIATTWAMKHESDA